VSSLGRLDGWPVTTAAAAVVTADGVVEAAGPQDEPLRWASVTKVLTALASWVALEEGTVGLDDPAGPHHSTVRHLLAHASGLAFDTDAVIAVPGAKRIYSNTGIEVLARHVGEAAGMPFTDYLREGVLQPLGLSSTRCDGSPAAGAVGPVADLARLALELQAPTLVSPATVAEATAVAFPGLVGILPGFGRQDPNDWGLGVEVRGHKSPHWTPATASPRTFGHFGQAGGFVWVDPEAGVALACLTDRDFGPWAEELWPLLGQDVLAAHGRP
jgi:CubicO group peptidase (beta-lactamase class C family)